MNIQLFGIVLALASNLVHGQELFKCKRENGTVAYTDKPCENGLQKQGNAWMSDSEIEKINREKNQLMVDQMIRRETAREAERVKEQRTQDERLKKLMATLPPTQQTNTSAPSGEDINRMTTYAVVIGRGIACGVSTSSATLRVSQWFDRVFTPGTSQHKTYMVIFAAGMEKHAQLQRSGKTPDSCKQVQAAFGSFPWP